MKIISQPHPGNERWSPQPPVLDLPPDGQVDIWRVHLDVASGSLRMLEKLLSPGEAERATRFYFLEDRNRFLVSHASLRMILARYLHSEPGQLGFSVNAYGKPSLDGGGLEFNLSHSGDFALVAVTRALRVGVDVERIRADISTDIIGARFFSKAEISELQSLPAEQQEVAFFDCWTRKEAYIKAQGMGLILPLDSFDVSLAPGQPAALRATRPDPEEAARWTLFSFEVGPGYAAAVAVEGQSLECRCWEWTGDV